MNFDVVPCDRSREELRLRCLEAAVASLEYVEGGTDITPLAEEFYQWVIDYRETQQEQTEGAIE